MSEVALGCGAEFWKFGRVCTPWPRGRHLYECHELAGHKLPSGTHRRVRETMDQVKHLTPPACWDDRPRLSVGGVTEECVTIGAETDVFQREACDGGTISLNSWVHPLAGRHGGVIYAIVECIDGGPGQRVSDMVVLALHMPNICGKFGDVCKLSLLTTDRMLWPYKM